MENKMVDKYGKLSVSGNYIVSESGGAVQLKGVSLFWSQWMGQYYTKETVKWLRDDWKCTVIRAAMGVEMGGYLENPETEMKKIMIVVDAAIEYGMYVIIDYHSHEAHKNTALAIRFFTKMAERYGKRPNIIYEIFNEPLDRHSWKHEIKPYSETIIKTIRQYDKDNIIIVGTRQWSQLVYEAACDPIIASNIVYSLHYYAASHGQKLRDEALKAMGKGIALFVSEFGLCENTGDGPINRKESKLWYDFLDKYKIGWCNWSLADKEETASLLIPGTSGKGNWKDSELTTSGKLVKQEIMK